MRSLQPNIPIWEYGILGSLKSPHWVFRTSNDGINRQTLETFDTPDVVIAINKISLKGWRFMQVIQYPLENNGGGGFAYFFERLKPNDTL